MSDLSSVGAEIVATLEEILDELRTISARLELIEEGVFFDPVITSIDQVSTSIAEATKTIVGDRSYNLTDLHDDLNIISSTIESSD